MRIVGFGSENMASTHLRNRCWINALKKRGHDAVFLGDPFDRYEAGKIDADLDGADIVLYGRTHDAKKVAVLMAGRKAHGYKLVVDTDDLITDIPTSNFATRVYHSGTGVARIGEAQYRQADALLVSTPTLHQKSAHYNARTFLVPNTIDMDLWGDVRFRAKEARHADDIRIYWGGGGGHYDDLAMIRDPLLNIFHEFPKVKLIFSNFVPGWAATLPPHRVFFMRLIEYREFPKLLSWICADIGLAPLTDHPHNRCKSNVKWLDYAMAGIPGVYSKLDPYSNVRHGETGMIAANDLEWYNAIRRLVLDAGLRKDIANEARDDAMTFWTTDRHVARVEAMFQSIIHEKQPKPAVPLIEGAPIEADQCLTQQF